MLNFTNRKMHLAIPDGIDHTEIMRRLGRHYWKALLIIHKLNWLASNKSDKDIEWFEIPAYVLRYYVHPKYLPKVIDVLLDMGIIQRNKSYIVGKRFKQYKLSNHNYGHWITCEDKTINKHFRLYLARRSLNNELSEATDVDHWLLLSLGDVGIKKGADTVIEQVTTDYKDYLRQVRNYHATLQIEYSGYDYHIDDYGRRHTPITRLSKDLRNNLYFKTLPHGKLVELDIKNSQPLFLCLDIINTLTKGDRVENIPVTSNTVSIGNSMVIGDNAEKVIEYDLFDENEVYVKQDSIDDKAFIGENKEMYNNIGRATPPYPYCCTLLQELPEDMQLFIKTAEAGGIYDYFMKELKMDRRLFKDNFFHYIFYGYAPKVDKDIEIIKLFKSRYPSVWDYIKKAKDGNFKLLSRRMQALESNYMFNQVLPRIKDELPDTRVLTVHDSIICLDSHKWIIYDIMKDQMLKNGLNVKIDCRELKCK